ncbi:type II secretion system protein M [Parasalinivibrio latis]|uniref:type II secretion system protein M n=1 Tax=Parasalinivibrio latis TaxID=2952610 RepID=UPI0006D13233
MKQWWSSISARERNLVLVCGAFLLVAVAYWGVIEPMNNRATQAQSRLAAAKSLDVWVKNKANDIMALRGTTGAGAPAQNLSLNQVITATVRPYNIQIERIQPRNEQVQVAISPVPFNQLMAWIDNLAVRYGVTVDVLELSRGDQNGMVTVNRLLLSKV